MLTLLVAVQVRLRNSKVEVPGRLHSVVISVCGASGGSALLGHQRILHAKPFWRAADLPLDGTARALQRLVERREPPCLLLGSSKTLLRGSRKYFGGSLVAPRPSWVASRRVRVLVLHWWL